MRFDVFCMVTRPAGCGERSCWSRAAGLAAGSDPGGGALACGAPRVLNSTPAEAVVSLATIVLLMKFTFSASWSETPPPSQPATLLVMMLLVTVTPYHSVGVSGKRLTSVPLTSGGGYRRRCRFRPCCP